MYEACANLISTIEGKYLDNPNALQILGRRLVDCQTADCPWKNTCTERTKSLRQTFAQRGNLDV